MDTEVLFETLKKIEPQAETREKSSKPAVRVPVECLPSFMPRLHDDEALAFDLLVTHTAIDWPTESVLELVYMLYSTAHGHWLMVTATVPREKPVAPTVSRIWPIAEWQEREAYDLFGVQYDNHPDLRRIFMDDDWVGHPLRKDYQDDYMLELPK